MPTYEYRKNDGAIVEVTMTVVEMERRQKSDGSIILDDGLAARRVYRAHLPPSNYPQISNALGCRPKNIARQRAWNKQHGIRLDYNAKGQALIESEAHRKQLVKAMNRARPENAPALVDFSSYG